MYRTINLDVVLYGCETWSLTLKEERRLRLLENRMSRRIFSQRDETTGEWRKVHNEELNDLYSSPNIIRVIKSRKMRWLGHVAVWGRAAVHTSFWWGNLKEIDHLEGPDVDKRIILKWTFRKWNVGAWTGSIWLRIEIDGGHL
jgi:hypothetical protein